MDTAKESAAQAVAEYLKHPDDLVKLPTIRKKIAREKASLEVKLKDTAKEQLDQTKDGIDRLARARGALGGIREDFETLARLKKEETEVDGWAMLVEVSRVHRHFVLAAQMSQNLLSLFNRIRYTQRLLSVDRADPYGPSESLLKIHYHLSEMEAFRNETVVRAKTSTEEERATLDRYFEPLGSVLEAFEAHYLHLAGSIIEIARAGHPSVAIKIVKIAEVERSRDEKAATIRLLKKHNQDLAARFDSTQAEARTIKHYRAKVLECVRASTKTAIDRAFVKARSEPTVFLEDLGWLFDDLALVRNELATRFPADWKIEEQYCKAYHKALYEFLKGLLNKEGGEAVDAASMLAMSQFVKEYRNTMIKELEFPEEWLTPSLFDGKEQDLVDDYLKLIVKKMTEWTDNLMKTETKDFVAREEEPPKDGEGKYALQGAVILFEMFNQQINLALDSNQALVVARVIEEANKVMKGAQAQWRAVLESEYKKFIESKPGSDDVAPGLIEYIMALANDQVKSADFADQLLSRLEPLVSDKYRDRINSAVNDAMDGYVDTAKKCVDLSIQIVFKDMKSATGEMFGNSWYFDNAEGRPTYRIVETMRDYLNDFRNQLNPDLLDLLIADLVDSFLITYLVNLRKASKLKIPSAADRIRDDVKMVVQMFAQFKDPRELKADFAVLDGILGLLKASKTIFVLDYYNFAKEFGPNLKFVEGIVKARDDFDRSSTNDVIESIRRKGESMEKPPNPTIFDRLPK